MINSDKYSVIFMSKKEINRKKKNKNFPFYLEIENDESSSIYSPGTLDTFYPLNLRHIDNMKQRLKEIIIYFDDDYITKIIKEISFIFNYFSIANRVYFELPYFHIKREVDSFNVGNTFVGYLGVREYNTEYIRLIEQEINGDTFKYFRVVFNDLDYNNSINIQNGKYLPYKNLMIKNIKSINKFFNHIKNIDFNDKLHPLNESFNNIMKHMICQI